MFETVICIKMIKVQEKMKTAHSIKKQVRMINKR